MLWLLADDPALSERAFDTIADPQTVILVSAAPAWEIALKVRSGKLPTGVDLVQNFSEFLERVGLIEVPISSHQAIRAGLLLVHDKDPFDRMLAAQCQRESIPIISNDRIFEHYGVDRSW